MASPNRAPSPTPSTESASDGDHPPVMPRREPPPGTPFAILIRRAESLMAEAGKAWDKARSKLRDARRADRRVALAERQLRDAQRMVRTAEATLRAAEADKVRADRKEQAALVKANHLSRKAARAQDRAAEAAPADWPLQG